MRTFHKRPITRELARYLALCAGPLGSDIQTNSTGGGGSGATGPAGATGATGPGGATGATGPGSTAGMVQLGQVITAGSQANAGFSSINQGYTTLLVIYSGTTTASVGDSGLMCQFNGDTTSGNYVGQIVGSANASAATGSTGVGCGQLCGRSSFANAISSGAIWFPNYSKTSIHKSLNTLSGGDAAGSSSLVYMYACQWKSTAAVTDLLFTPSSGNWTDNSVITLYGLL